jgi:hypothetical protein
MRLRLAHAAGQERLKTTEMLKMGALLLLGIDFFVEPDAVAIPVGMGVNIWISHIDIVIGGILLIR